ncbi:hypothetical protein ACEC37_002787 [Vibrio fluvialis]
MRQELDGNQAYWLIKLTHTSSSIVNKGEIKDKHYFDISETLLNLSRTISWMDNIELDDIEKLSIHDRQKLSAICQKEDYSLLLKQLSVIMSRGIMTSGEYAEKVITPLMELFTTSIDNIDHKPEVSGLLEQLRLRQNELNKALKEATSSISNHADSNINKLEREFKRSTSEITNNINKLESEALQKIESLVSKTQIQLSEIESRQRNELEKQTVKHINEAIDYKRIHVFEKLEDDCDKLLKNIHLDINSLSVQVAEEIDKFCVLNDALRKTLSFISSDALADASIEQAKIEKKSADNLRIIGVSWLIFAIFLFLTTFDYDALVDKNGVPQYTLILLRSFFLIVGSAPAFYILRESARHRTDERRYRQKGIQLATIDGYLSEFDDTDRNTVKKELTKHYFHGGDHFVDSSSIDSVQGIYEKILDRILSSDRSKETASQKSRPE